MRILEISSATELGGGERHFIDLARGLSARGHRVDLLLRPASPLRTALPEFRIFELPLRGPLDLKSIYSISKLLNGYDLVHAHYARDYPSVAIAVGLARRHNPKLCYVFTRHHYLPLKRNALYRKLLSTADASIAVSGYVAQTLQECLKWSISSIDSVKASPTIVRIPNWVTPERYTTSLQKEAAKDRLRVPLDKLLITCINQLHENKGQHLLLEACAELSNTHILFAGKEHNSSAYTLRLKKDAERLGLVDRVTFAGYVEDISSLFAATDICVIPSLYEAFSIVCLEAMSARQPVVASSTGGLTELIEDGVTGVHFKPGSSRDLAHNLRRLIDSPELKDKIVENAYKQVLEHYSYERVIEQTDRLFQELLCRRSR